MSRPKRRTDFLEDLENLINKVKIALTMLAMLFAVAPLRAQDALVTFYMSGSEWKTGLPGTKTGMYFGPVYDGSERLFTFYNGFFWKNNRFVTMRLPAGPHMFTTDAKHPSPERSAALTLKAGAHYYISATSQSRGIVVVEVERGMLREVSCEVAQTNAQQAKPVGLKRVAKPFVAQVVDESTFPGCY